VSNSSGVVWARAYRPARMLVEWSTTESFKSVHHAGFVDALPETDCTANMLLENLPAGKHIFYRIRFEDFSSPTISRGGMRTYATMLRHRPDFFIHSGDNIYADVPIASEQKMPNGEIWRNIVRSSPRKRGPS
jgi:alkaline phosphatase D